MNIYGLYLFDLLHKYLHMAGFQPAMCNISEKRQAKSLTYNGFSQEVYLRLFQAMRKQ
ncbi:MAG: hypothetical protein LC108_00220 [Anaerolineales bacterium]|nr:hypothetical protein [Anaerolineales bacterium]